MARQLSMEQLEQLRSVDSPSVCNAIEAFKVRQGELGLRDYAHSREFTLEDLRARLLGK
ncbi:MAG TPA: hypothetical protein VLM91_01380 [Candidatus Methylomirabilis sp.]|nr:hypothetical protein [Candidatus Methylomirabilis sp.]